MKKDETMKIEDRVARDAKGTPDFRLVLSVLEKRIVAGEDEPSTRKVLAEPRIWKRLCPDLKLKWARLAQMAGEATTALAVLEELNRRVPEMEEAWKERISLLSILERKNELARAVALYKTLLGKSAPVPPAGSIQDDRVVESASAPFESMRSRRMAVERFMELFQGREDCHARQWADESRAKQGYAPVRRPLEFEDVEDHLKGKITLGIYLLRTDSKVRTGVIDVDLAKRYRKGKLAGTDRAVVSREQKHLFARIRELSAKRGLSPLVEFSGSKGYHFWFLFSEPVPAGRVREALTAICNRVAGEISAFGLEVFPKQDSLEGKAMGNLVKLPLGVHRLSGKRSYFTDCPNRSEDAQLEFLKKVEAVSPRKADLKPPPVPVAQVTVHPGCKKKAPGFAELRTLETFCPPLAKIANACRAKRQITREEEKVLFQTLGFLPAARTLLHHLMGSLPDYNPHMTDYKLDRVRGAPMGCRRIHGILEYEGPFCDFGPGGKYAHPLRHLGYENPGSAPKAEKIVNLSSALENLKLAIAIVERHLT